MCWDQESKKYNLSCFQTLRICDFKFDNTNCLHIEWFCLKIYFVRITAHWWKSVNSNVMIGCISIQICTFTWYTKVIIYSFTFCSNVLFYLCWLIQIENRDISYKTKYSPSSISISWKWSLVLQWRTWIIEFKKVGHLNMDMHTFKKVKNLVWAGKVWN